MYKECPLAHPRLPRYLGHTENCMLKHMVLGLIPHENKTGDLNGSLGCGPSCLLGVCLWCQGLVVGPN